MGRPAKTRNYHSYFWDILESLKQNDLISFRFPTKKAAKNFQLDFLAFRNACVNEKLDQTREHWVELQQNPTDEKKKGKAYLKDPIIHQPEFPELNAYKTRTRQEDETFIVDIYHMDKDESTRFIEEQIAALGVK